MKKFDWIKALGMATTIGGVLISLVSGFVEDKKLDAKIDEKIQKRLTD